MSRKTFKVAIKWWGALDNMSWFIIEEAKDPIFELLDGAIIMPTDSLYLRIKEEMQKLIKGSGDSPWIFQEDKPQTVTKDTITLTVVSDKGKSAFQAALRSSNISKITIDSSESKRERGKLAIDENSKLKSKEAVVSKTNMHSSNIKKKSKSKNDTISK